jgi:hypothetical protein
VSISSLGLIDNLQLAATGLEPGKRYRLLLVEGTNRQDLAVFTAGIGGTAIVQTFGPLKHVGGTAPDVPETKLQVRHDDGVGELVLEQSEQK